jgi:hypothetical protein
MKTLLGLFAVAIVIAATSDVNVVNAQSRATGNVRHPRGGGYVTINGETRAVNHVRRFQGYGGRNQFRYGR